VTNSGGRPGALEAAGSAVTQASLQRRGLVTTNSSKGAPQRKQPSFKPSQQQQQAASSTAPSQPPPAEMPSELSEAVEQVVAHMGSKDWRERCDALRALAALAPAARALSEPGLEALVGALAGRMGDSNAKVQQQALEVRGL